MKRSAILLGALSAAGLLLAGCGSSNSGALKITSFLPSSLPAGNGEFTISITGTGFDPSDTIQFGTTTLTPFNFEIQNCSKTPCPGTLSASVPPQFITSAGSVSFYIKQPSTGDTSNTVNLVLTSPVILGLSPVAVAAGGPGFPLSLSVVNAADSVEVLFGKTELVPAGPVSCKSQTACRVTVTVPAAAVASTGSVTLTVSNPQASSGGTVQTNFLVVAPAASGQSPALQSANGSTPGNGNSTHSSTSDGGVLVAFDSVASNLATGTTQGHSEVYVHQNCPTGTSNCKAQTTLVSVASDGSPGSGGAVGSETPAISPDGRFVAFSSDDTNLVSGASTGVAQVYLRDTCTSIFGAVQNCTAKTTLVSADSSGNPGNAPSVNPSISASGLFVAFESSATNLVGNRVPSGVNQIYLSNSCNGLSGAVSGCKASLQLLSFDQNSHGGDHDSVSPAVDPLGISVAFQSLADNILAGIASNGSQQIYLRSTCLEADTLLAASCPQKTILISADASNSPGTSDSLTPDVSENGFVVFSSSAMNLLPGNASGQQILGSQVCLNVPSTTSCVPSGNIVLSVDKNGVPGTAASTDPALNGATVAFTSQATLVSGAPPGQVYSAPACLPPAGTCMPGPVVVSTNTSGTAITGDLASIGGGGFISFFTTGNPSPPGISQIFLASPAKGSSPTMKPGASSARPK
jgi:WD40-like Beta Propeller Repeat